MRIKASPSFIEGISASSITNLFGSSQINLFMISISLSFLVILTFNLSDM